MQTNIKNINLERESQRVSIERLSRRCASLLFHFHCRACSSCYLIFHLHLPVRLCFPKPNQTRPKRTRTDTQNTTNQAGWRWASWCLATEAKLPTINSGRDAAASPSWTRRHKSMSTPLKNAFHGATAVIIGQDFQPKPTRLISQKSHGRRLMRFRSSHQDWQREHGERMSKVARVFP